MSSETILVAVAALLVVGYYYYMLVTERRFNPRRLCGVGKQILPKILYP